MIRHPLNSATCRARPDMNRVADGIAASLRQFSISAQRCANNNNNDDDDGISDDPRRLTGRQRARAAVDELISTVHSTVEQTRSRMPMAARDGSEAQANAQQGEGLRQEGGGGGAQGQGSRVISTPAGFRGFQRISFGGARDNAITKAPPGANIIRGGFRGRGGGSPMFARGGGRGGFGEGASFRGRGRGGARGGFRGRDDRPRRGRGRGGPREGREKDQKESTAKKRIDDRPDVKAYLERKEMGETMAFNPQISLESLAGFGPGLATSATPFAAEEAVLRQARILGGGFGYHPTHLVNKNVLHDSYSKGNGIFVAPSEDARTWISSLFRNELKPPAPEVKTAVLEDALLGKYDGPKYAETQDTLGVVQSYVKRDGTWNVAAERRIGEKVRSLLEQSTPDRGGAATKEAKA
ncbi:hypothetical protein F5B19DRAFT_457783 [Rostrohypoxylon terebratum]|nr:hypothetical protein F5B19DRAFT_457783 [Rostrohypoxylon terebratum]